MNNIKIIRKIQRVLKWQFNHFEYKLSKMISPDWFDNVRYKLLIGERPNLKHPITWNEKLLWLNKNWQPDIKAELTDKLKVREYIKKMGLESLLIPLIGVWTNPYEIDFDSLPNQFALKCNHGSGTNIICKNKSELDLIDAKKKLKKWLSTDYGKLHNEKHYSKIKPMILCEEYLPAFEGSNSVIDYKIHCFNGQPHFFLVCSNRNTKTGQLTLTSFSLDWCHIYHLINDKKPDNGELNCPKNINKMIEYSKLLSNNFPYVRIDFYEINEKLYFGEFTFTPAANIMAYYNKETQIEYGKKLLLSNISYLNK